MPIPGPHAHRLGAHSLFLILFAITAVVPTVEGSAWQGRVETREGVEHVLNPAEPVAASLTLSPQELWRIGGDSESENEFFGVISQVATDPSGSVYLLDRQLSEVRVFSSSGIFGAQR